jgi:origin recognition complex subunit 1
MSQEDEVQFDSDESEDFDLMVLQNDHIMEENDEDLITPVTPGFDNDTLSKVRAKLALSARPETLPCREKEIERIYTALSLAVTEKSPVTMYIAGEPGTGKTACVTKVVQRLTSENGKDLKYAFINAMKLSSPAEAYAKLYEQIFKKGKVKKKEIRSKLSKFFNKNDPKKPYTLIVIDELDFLITRGQQEIYEFFNWPQLEHSRLAVVGISNIVTLPESLAPKIANRFQNTERIIFHTYSKEDIVKIISDRVKGLTGISPSAIEMCATKVASSSGDIRRGLDICRRAAEMVGKGNVVTADDIIKAYHDLFSSSLYPLTEMSIYHKLFLVCAVKEQIAQQKNDLSFEVVVSRMQTKIKELHDYTLIEDVTIREVLPICECLEAMQILTITRSEADRFSIIRLNTEKETINDKLKDDSDVKLFFETILN